MLTYEGDSYAVDLFDHVEIRIGGSVFQGQIKKIFPRAGEVRVAYLDSYDFTRAGGARRKVARVPVSDIELERRDG